MHAEGKDPRLVLDSTVCGVNPKCAVPERISLPMASDVREDTHSSFVGASFDFKAAHKQIQVHPSEHGLLLFRVADVQHCIAVTQTHSWPSWYVFCSNIGPDRWKKVQFQDNLTWCGWRINFLHETIELTPEKTIKLNGQLHELLKAGKVKRKLFEQVLGLLIWATSLSLELRPG